MQLNIQKIIKYALPLLMLFIIILVSYKMWHSYTKKAWTRDAKIRAEVVQIAAEIPGKLKTLAVIDNQAVQQGELLFEIDDRDYKMKVADVKAKEQLLKIQFDQANTQYQRRLRLPKSAISPEQLEAARTQVDALANQLQQAKIGLEKAELDLSRTKVYAPVDGYVTNLNLREGQVLGAGQPLVALVDKNSFYVMAYFEETKLPALYLGQEMTIEPYSGLPTMKGEIESIGRAILDRSATTGPQLIANVEPNYAWVRLSQRIPVRIRLTEPEKIAELSFIAGLSCAVHATK